MLFYTMETLIGAYRRILATAILFSAALEALGFAYGTVPERMAMWAGSVRWDTTNIIGVRAEHVADCVSYKKKGVARNAP